MWEVVVGWARRTWYFVRRVLHTPVRSIIPTRKGTAALFAMMIEWRLVLDRLKCCELVVERMKAVLSVR